MTVAVFEDQDHVRPSSSPRGCGLSKSLQISGENINAISSEPEKLSGWIFSALNFLKQNHMNNRTVRRFSRKKLGSRDTFVSSISPNLFKFRISEWFRECNGCWFDCKAACSLAHGDVIPHSSTTALNKTVVCELSVPMQDAAAFSPNLSKSCDFRSSLICEHNAVLDSCERPPPNP